MEKEEPINTIIRLMQAATEAEALVIGEVAVKAGFFWRCLATIPNDETKMVPCRWENTANDSACQRCGSPRPHELDPPPQVIHIMWYGPTLCGKPLDKEIELLLVQKTEAHKTTCEVCRCRAKDYSLLPP